MQRMAIRICLTRLVSPESSFSCRGLGFAQERARLRVSTLFIGSSLLPFWIAKDQGYFARAGVDVELISMQSNLSTSALLAGEVDTIFGTPQVPLQVMSTKGMPNFVAIAAWASSSEHWLVVNPAIKSIKDLDGKVLATSRPKSADHGYALTMLERNGVDTRRVTFLSTGGQAGRVARHRIGQRYGLGGKPLLCFAAAPKRVQARSRDWNARTIRSRRRFLSSRATACKLNGPRCGIFLWASSKAPSD